jgi:phosphoribosylpyrophosphate synthetase
MTTETAAAPVARQLTTINSSYIDILFDRVERRKILATARDLINALPENERPTGIVSTGVSGDVFGVLLSDALDLDLVIVRKDVNSHASYKVEGLVAGKMNKLMLVDDFIASGATIDRITKALSDFVRSHDHWSLTYQLCTTGIMYYNAFGTNTKRNDIVFQGLQKY